jgi:SET domain-containing protein
MVMPEHSDAALAQQVRRGPSPIHGSGCFAVARIAAGAFIGTFIGPTVAEDGAHVLWSQLDDQSWEGRRGTSVLRYLNHSERPNAAFDGFDLYALAAIPAGCEITIDYQP